MKPHKHAELIKAWANGAVIEHRCLSNPEFKHWHEFDEHWGGKDEWEYRIKPEPKPDIVLYQRITNCQPHPQGEFYAWASCCYSQILDDYPNVKLTFDGETGELKSAEVLK